MAMKYEQKTASEQKMFFAGFAKLLEHPIGTDPEVLASGGEQQLAETASCRRIL